MIVSQVSDYLCAVLDHLETDDMYSIKAEQAVKESSIEGVKSNYIVEKTKESSNYYGTKDVQYTVKISGKLIVQSMRFPYQRSVWKVSQEETDGMIEYIKSIINLTCVASQMRGSRKRESLYPKLYSL